MRTPKTIIAVLGGLLVLVLAIALCPAASAQESWSPFRQGRDERDETRPPRSEAAAPLPPAPARERAGEPAYQAPAPWNAPRRGGVERSELAPVMAPDASGLPLELWRGLDLKGLEELLSGIELPPRSPSLHQLWRRMLLSSATPPAGAPDPEHFVAVRLEALYRSGLLADMEAVLTGSGISGPVVQILRARRDIGLGRREEGCATVKSLAAPNSGVPARLKGETQLLAGYCAVVGGDAHAAGLAAELAREEGVEAELPLAVLAGVASGAKPKLALPQRVLLLDYRFLELLGPVNALQVFDKAEPALLAMLAGDTRSDARLQIAAAEAALRINAVAPEAIAEVYRGRSLPRAGQTDPAASDPLLRRALYFQAIEAARTPAQRARFLHALLDDARRSGFGLQMARVVAPLAGSIFPSPEIPWFAETALELALVAGNLDIASRWAQSGNLQHWQGLIDLVDPARRGGRLPSLAAMEELAARGQLRADTLHRLATVLDALDIDVPITLWDAANRAPQPATGYLPETGVLADLAQSARQGAAARTILLAMRSLGPGGAEAANVLALGDAIRALKRIGLDADARRLGLEALLGAWPRAAVN
ncbi:MAG: hypothetical protein AB7O44_23275 [Hyphomicrobiaceae bacterium]